MPQIRRHRVDVSGIVEPRLAPGMVRPWQGCEVQKVWRGRDRWWALVYGYRWPVSSRVRTVMPPVPGASVYGPAATQWIRWAFWENRKLGKPEVKAWHNRWLEWARRDGQPVKVWDYEPVMRSIEARRRAKRMPKTTPQAFPLRVRFGAGPVGLGRG